MKQINKIRDFLNLIKLGLANSPDTEPCRSGGGQRGRILVLFILTSYFSFPQVSEGRRITQELCSSKYFGRGYVKSGDSLAAEYLATEF